MQLKSKALFLDRDGVINTDYGYVYQIDNFEFISGIFDIVSQAKKAEYLVIVITNQSGIGRGLYSEAEFHSLSRWMCEAFESSGSCIDHIYFSPYHPTQGQGEYRQDHYSRKPNPGMILRAKKDFNINLESSILIGDKLSDIHAGLKAGVGRNILLSADDLIADSNTEFESVKSLADAIKFINFKN